MQAELRRIAAEEDPASAIALIVEWGILPAIDSEAPERVRRVAELASRPPWAGWVDRGLAVTLAIVRPLPQIRELATATPERASEGARLAEAWDPAQLLVARALGAEWLDRYAEESEAYNAHESAQTALGREPTMPMPEWPKVYPWHHLKDAPAPPRKKLTGFSPVYG